MHAVAVQPVWHQLVLWVGRALSMDECVLEPMLPRAVCCGSSERTTAAAVTSSYATTLVAY